MCARNDVVVNPRLTLTQAESPEQIAQARELFRGVRGVARLQSVFSKFRSGTRRASRRLRSAGRPVAAGGVSRPVGWLRRAAQAGLRNLRDEAALSSSAISRQRRGTRAGGSRDRGSPRDRVPENAPRYRRAGNAECRGDVSPAGIHGDRTLSPQSDCRRVVHGTANADEAVRQRCFDYERPYLLLVVDILFLRRLQLRLPAATSVSYKSGDETVQGMLYTPEAKGRFPALVVIHEWWGLNDWVKEQAAKLADQGYVTLAIDLYRGKVATTPDEAHEIMRGVPEDRAARDLHAAVGVSEIAAERKERPHRLDRMVHGRRILAQRGAAGAQPWLRP